MYDTLNAASVVQVAGDATQYMSSAHQGDIEVAAKSDANGVVSVTINNDGAKNNDQLWIRVTADGVSNAFDSTVYWETTSYDIGHAVIAPNGGEDAYYAIGAKYTVSFEIHDQWGLANPGSGYRVDLTSSDDRATGADWAGYATSSTLTGGKVSFSLTDNGAGPGAFDYNAQLTEGASTYVDDVNGSINFVPAGVIAPDAFSITKTNYGTAATNSTTARAPEYTQDDYELRAFNTDFIDQNWSNTGWLTENLNNGVVIAGTLETATAAGIAGQAVTISAPGLVVARSDVDDSGPYVASVGSVTTYTDNNGDFEFWVWSSKPGAQTVTITSGSVTKTTTVYFQVSAAKTVTLVANGGKPSAQAGRSIAVVATVKDADGNLVEGREVTFTASGYGAFDDATVETDASGVATAHYLTGANETGLVDFVATVKVAAAVANVSAAQAAAAASTKATVTFVTADGSIAKKGKYVTAKWSVANGKKVIITIDGYRKYAKVMADDNAHSKKFKLKKGKHVVNLYVGGVLVDTAKYYVK